MRYLFSLKKELLELQLIEMDNTLSQLFAGRNTVELVHNKQRRAFLLDWNEGLLSGRGILGFFRNIPEGRIFIEPLDDGAYELIPPEVSFPGVSLSRDAEVLARMAVMESDSAPWFNLYQNAIQFKVAGWRENLICLNQLKNIDKYQYQIDTVLRVFNDFRGRAILADEVGLGKTVEAGMAMTEYIMRGLVKNVLILTPASLVDQWYFEMKSLFNQDFIRSDDPKFKRGGADSWRNYRKVIASLSAAKRKGTSEHITAIPYDMVIVDEAHHLKNRKSVAWQFVNSLNKKYMLLLSATPVQNSLEELYNLITLIRPGQLKTYVYFKKNFIADKMGLEVKDRSRLKELLSGAVIRNRRSAVDIKFTKRFAKTLYLKTSGAEKALYDDVSAFVREEYADGSFTRFSLKNLQERLGSCSFAAAQSIKSLLDGKELEFEARTRISGFYEKAVASAKEPSPKMIALARLLHDFGDQMIVFTKYRATLEALVAYLGKEGFETAEFPGGMRRAEKEGQIRKFQAGARVLVSTETGGEGRNLQFCNGLVNFDLPWNPMAIEQRIGRIHRIGQERDVYVFNLCAEDTVEHYILQILDRKINMFELAVGEVDMILGDLEEKTDFSEMVMNFWTKSETSEEMEREMDALGELMLDNKRRLERIKTVDDALFA